MRLKLIGAAAAVAILASGLGGAMAQTPSEQPSPPAQQPTETPAPATPAAMPPATAPDTGNSMQGQPHADQQPAPVAAPTPTPVKHHVVSACQKAIQASERALKKSQASPDTIAQAWQHIENAKQEKGAACKDDAKQAQEML